MRDNRTSGGNWALVPVTDTFDPYSTISGASEQIRCARFRVGSCIYV